MALDLLPDVLPGVAVTVQVTAVGLVVAVLAAFTAGLARLVPWWPIRFVAALYVEIFRGSSAFVQLYAFFFLLPIFGVFLSPFAAGVAAIGLNFGAYGSEIVRAAIKNVPAGQWEAAAALDLRPRRTMARIILPQAIPAMLPGFGNLAVELLKATSLVGFVTISDLANRGRLAIEAGSDPADAYLTILGVYFVLAIPLLLTTRWLERRVKTGPRRRPAI